jgi:carbonic anhydrase/acetyltransferase-like protein (isoleucine patch superfamily)
MIFSLESHSVSLADSSVYIAESASVIGQARLESDCSVWFGAVVRADDDNITIGKGSNVQDNAVLHVDQGSPLNIGAGVTIGHKAMLHGCTIEDNVLIGINAVVLDKAVIGRDSLIGANAMVTAGKVIPPRSLVLGSPAKVVRELTDEEVESIKTSAENYQAKAKRYQQDCSQQLMHF